VHTHEEATALLRNAVGDVELDVTASGGGSGGLVPSVVGGAVVDDILGAAASLGPTVAANGGKGGKGEGRGKGEGKGGKGRGGAADGVDHGDYVTGAVSSAGDKGGKGGKGEAAAIAGGKDKGGRGGGATSMSPARAGQGQIVMQSMADDPLAVQSSYPPASSEVASHNVGALLGVGCQQKQQQLVAAESIPQPVVPAEPPQPQPKPGANRLHPTMSQQQQLAQSPSLQPPSQPQLPSSTSATQAGAKKPIATLHRVACTAKVVAVKESRSGGPAFGFMKLTPECLRVAVSTFGSEAENDLFFLQTWVKMTGYDFPVRVGDTLSCMLRPDPRSSSGFGIREIKVEQVWQLTPEELRSYLQALDQAMSRNAEDALVRLSRCPAPWRYALDWRGGDLLLDIVRLLLSILHGACASRALNQRKEDLYQSLCGTNLLSKSGLLVSFLEELMMLEGVKDDTTAVKRSDAKGFLVQVDSMRNVQAVCNEVKRFLKETIRLVPGLARSCVRIIQTYFRDDAELLFAVIWCLMPNSFAVGDLEWHELPVLLTKEELLRESDPMRLAPSVLTTGAYDSPSTYLDTYFRLMRLEGFGKLRDGIRALLNGTLDPRDMSCYTAVEVVGVRFGAGSNASMTLALTFDTQGRKKDQDIMFGNLVCLTIDGTFRDPIWAVVAHFDLGDKRQGPTLFVRLYTENNRQDDLGILLALMGRKSFMVESPTYFNAIAPVLQALKQHDPMSLPFEKELVYAMRGDRPAYISPDSLINALHVFSSEPTENSLDARLHSQPVEGELTKMKVSTFVKILQEKFAPEGLYSSYPPSQRNAIAAALQQRVAVIQGPPGTGKSTVGRTLIALLQSLDSRPPGPILLLSYKNHALDDVLESVAQDEIVSFDKIVRVGSRSKSELLSKRNLKFLMNSPGNSSIASRIEVRSCEAKVNDLIPLLMSLAKSREEASYLTDDAATAAFVDHAPIEHIQQLVQRLGRSMLSLMMELRDKIATIVERLSSQPDAKPSKDSSLSHQKTAVAELEPIRETLRLCVNRCLHARGCVRLLDQRWQFDELGLSPQQEKNLLSLSFNVVSLLMKWVPNVATVQSLQRRERAPVLPDSIAASARIDISVATDTEADEQDANKVEARRKLAGDEDNEDWFTSGFVSFSGSQRAGSGAAVRLKELEEPLTSVEILMMREHSDIWQGTQQSEERGLLLHTYMQARVEVLERQFKETCSQYEKACKDLLEMKEKHKADVLKGADLIGMTSTGAALNMQALAALRPAIVIVEEAAELLESQVLAVLRDSVQHLILIGDHKQLRPNVENFDLVKHKSFDVSLFERLVNNGLLSGTLDMQSRMRPEFVPLLKTVYPLLSSHPRVERNVVPKCLRYSMFFWTHDFPEQSERSCKNAGEAAMIKKLVTFVIAEGTDSGKVTIIASYSAQVKALRDLLRDQDHGGVNVCTIDEFQGDENDVIIVSLVRSRREANDQRMASIGYLNVQNRLVVASSRARCAMIFVGNATHLKTCTERQANSRNAPSTLARWDELLLHMDAQGLVSPNIPLQCPRHLDAPPILLCSGKKPLPSVRHSVAHELAELAEVPNWRGLCASPCNAMMGCQKHTCKILWCHPQFYPNGDDPHDANRCSEIVQFSLNCGHAGAAACHIPKAMFQCQQKIPFCFRTCGHDGIRICFQTEDEKQCTKPCARLLACGHPCPLACFQDCASADCPACAEKARIEAEEQQKIIEATIKAAREGARKEAKLHRQKGSEFVRQLLPDSDPFFHECRRIVHLNQQADHNNPIMVTAVEKVYNAKLETAFQECKQDLVDPTCEPVYKFHGTSVEGVNGICKDGFRQPDASNPNMDKKSGGTKLPMYGHGVYLASDSTKSAQKEYTQGSNMLLVCKTLLGRSLTLTKPDNHLEKKKLRKMGFDSVFAPAGSAVRFDEYIVYDARQVVVAYVVHFMQGHARLPATPLSMSGGVFRQDLFPKREFDPKDEMQMHFRIAESQFLRTHLSSGSKLIKVEYFANPRLIKAFEEQKAEFKRNGVPDKMVLAFHGTKSRAAVEAIVENNFDLARIGSATDAGWYGKGFYFSEFADTSMSYGGGANMLLCWLLPGKEYDTETRMDGKPIEAGYNSHRVAKNANGCANELVIDNPKQILPCYILHFGPLAGARPS
jgi:hypothetical protein